MERFLVALDGSPREHFVLGTASQMASRTGAKLVLFHAISLPVELPSEALAISPDAVGRVLEESMRRHLEGLASKLPSGQVAGLRIDFGSPWRSICDAAVAEHADLIIIGSHGYGGIDHLIGTTAAKVANHADRSLLIVRQQPPN